MWVLVKIKVLQVKKNNNKKTSTIGWVAIGAKKWRNAGGWHTPQKGKKEGTSGNPVLKILLTFLKNLKKLPEGTGKALSSFEWRNHMAKMLRKLSLETVQTEGDREQKPAVRRSSYSKANMGRLWTKRWLQRQRSVILRVELSGCNVNVQPESGIPPRLKPLVEWLLNKGTQKGMHELDMPSL